MIFGSTVITDLIGVEVVQFDQTIGGGSSCLSFSLPRISANLLKSTPDYFCGPFLFLFLIRNDYLHCHFPPTPLQGDYLVLVGKSSVTWK